MSLEEISFFTTNACGSNDNDDEDGDGGDDDDGDDGDDGDDISSNDESVVDAG